MNKGNMKLNNVRSFSSASFDLLTRVSQIALAFSGLERLEEGQKGIENFFGATSTKSKPSTASASTKRSHSPSPVRPSNAAQPSPKKPRLPTLYAGKRKTALDSFLAKRPDSATNEGPVKGSGSRSPIIIDSSGYIEILDDPRETSNGTANAAADGSWICPKCQTVLSAATTSELKEKKQEHEDYHFALELQNGPSPVRQPRPKVGEKFKKKEAKGIQRFFEPEGGGKSK